MGHAKIEKAEKNENWGHSALSEELKQERAIRPFGVSSRESFSLRGAVRKDRQKHSESVREWKRKIRHFSLLKLDTRKINWWNSHEVFECYNHEELEYSKKDFTTDFVVRLYLLIKIYLLYIQFIVDSSLA